MSNYCFHITGITRYHNCTHCKNSRRNYRKHQSAVILMAGHEPLQSSTSQPVLQKTWSSVNKLLKHPSKRLHNYLLTRGTDLNNETTSSKLTSRIIPPSSHVTAVKWFISTDSLTCPVIFWVIYSITTWINARVKVGFLCACPRLSDKLISLRFILTYLLHFIFHKVLIAQLGPWGPCGLYPARISYWSILKWACPDG